MILTDHVGYCVEASQSETCLQQPEKPANSSWPAGVCAHVEISIVSLGPEIDDETDLAKSTTFRHRQGSWDSDLGTNREESLNHSRTVYKFGEDEFAASVIGRCACEYRDRDDDESGNRPCKSSFRNVRKQRVAEGVEQERN